MTGEVMDDEDGEYPAAGGTCAEGYCSEPRPAPGLETAFGGYVVGGVYYCAMHGYGHYLKAKRQQKQADWEKGKAEFDRRREEKQAAQTEQQKQRRAGWLERVGQWAERTAQNG